MSLFLVKTLSLQAAERKTKIPKMISVSAVCKISVPSSTFLLSRQCNSF